MTITLEDVSMITGLRIRGQPVTGDVVSAGWEDRVQEFLGVPLPEPQPGVKRRSSGVPLRWLRGQFAQCPPDADKATVNFYCR